MKKKLMSILITMSMLVTFLPVISVGASADINIGEYLQMGTYYGEPILWRCVDIDENGPLMLSDKIISIKPFDAAGDNTSGSHGRGYGDGSYRKSWGSNYWADSNMRCWLNSDASAGNVNWTCGNPPTEDKVYYGYNEYADEAGFLSNFSLGERNAIKPVTQKSLLDGYEHDSNTRNENYHRYDSYIEDVMQNYDTAYSEQVTDSVFLLDVKQAHRVYSNGNILGEDYYIGEPTAQAVEKSEYKSSSLGIGNKWYYWLRSPSSSNNSSYARVVNSGGYVNNSSAYYNNVGVRPAFYLNQLSARFTSGNGTLAAPYTVEGSGSYIPEVTPAPTPEPTPTPTPTPTIKPYLFEVEKYRANEVMTGLSGKTLFSMENTYFEQTPGKVLVEAGKKNGLDKLTEFWRGMNDEVGAVNDISKIADLAFEEKDMYEAIIWAIFESGADFKLISNIDSTIADNGKKVYDFVSGQMKSMYNLSVADKGMYNALSDKQKQEWKKLVTDSFESEYSSLSKSIDIADKMDLFFDVAKDIEDLINRCAAYYELSSMQDSLKQVLKEMYQQCPSDEIAMKAALLNCVTVMNSNEAAVSAEIAASVAGTTGKRFGMIGMSAMWSSVMTGVKNAHPAVAVFMMAYKSGTFVSNALFNTDAIEEAYHKLDAVIKVENVARSAYYKLKKQYINDETETNAAHYNSAIDIMFNAKDYDCDTSISFIDSVSSSAAGAVISLLGDKTAEERKKSVKSIQDSSYSMYESILTSWVYQLEEDDKQTYEQYKYVLEESEKRINKRYHIACPVDVYVYDKIGQEVASVVNNKTSVNDNSDIVITAYNDEKFVYLDDDKYSLEYKATGNGTMDITIDEYNEKGKTERTVGFDDLLISRGDVYKSEDSGEYTLTLDGSTVEPDYDTAKNKADAVKKLLETDSDISTEKITNESNNGKIDQNDDNVHQNDDTTSLNQYQKAAINYVTENAIMTGYDDGTIKPYNSITRAEFAAMMCRRFGFTTSEKSLFDDVQDTHWASSYIRACTDKGAINGIGDNKFNPDGMVTFEQAVKIITVLCGYEKQVSIYEMGGYPDGYVYAAEEYHLTDDMTVTVNGQNLPRIDVAMLIYNCRNKPEEILGENIIKKYDYIGWFNYNHHQFAEMEKDEKWGVIDSKGNEVISPKYDYVDIRGDGEYIIVNNGKKSALVDVNGNIVLDFDYSIIDFCDNNKYLTVCSAGTGKDRTWALIDYEGREIIPVGKYTEMNYCSDNYIVVEYDDEYGVIDINENQVVPFDFNYIFPFYEQRMLHVSDDDGMYGIADLKGNIIIDTEYDDIEGGRVLPVFAQKNDKWGKVDRNNEIVVGFNYDYDHVYSYIDGAGKYSIAEKNDVFCIIDSNLEMLTGYDFDDIEDAVDYILKNRNM
ncbi:MAG: S-layer homology domain-containing protein [bacterium]|nr:S-layer homology domain-containing protein [bacterium]